MSLKLRVRFLGLTCKQLLKTIPNKLSHTRRIRSHLDHRDFEYNKALKALKRYESGAPDERAMREIARKVDNVYNLDSNFLKYLLGILEEEMMAEGTETNDMMGLSSLPALPEIQQPRGNKTSLIGLEKVLLVMETPVRPRARKGKKAGPKRRRMEDEDSDEDLNENS
jgi:hypothetical protein